MRHDNSVFHGLLKHIPWSTFEKLVSEHGADIGVRKLNTRSQFIALLYGQLSGATSLREIETAMQSHSNRLYHLGARQVSRSTLADANALRPHAVFCGLFATMAGAASRGLRRHVQEAVRLIDSTSLRLAGAASQWAQFSQGTGGGARRGVRGAKAHIVYDPDADRPLYLEVTTARVNDITMAKEMPIEAGATYVFDMGYYDFGWWASLDRAGCRIVTRLKSHTKLVGTRDLPLPDGSPLLHDRIGHLPERMARSRQNPYGEPMREIGVVLEDGKVLRVATNDLDAPAQEIAELYKRRWAIELFFRWVKQTLKIKHFLGRSENAVRIQIAVALIAYLILRLAQETHKIVRSPLAFTRLVRANIMHRKSIPTLGQPANVPPPETPQLSFNWKILQPT